MVSKYGLGESSGQQFNNRCERRLVCEESNYGWFNQWKPAELPEEEWKELAEWHRREDCHNMAFLDGHVRFLNIQKGLYVTDKYTVLPFQELFGLALEAQSQLQEQED